MEVSTEMLERTRLAYVDDSRHLFFKDALIYALEKIVQLERAVLEMQDRLHQIDQQ